MSEMTASPDGGELDEAYYPELDELPPRPRRKLLTPTSLALLLALFAAGGFIGGVEVQKGQGGSSGASLASSLASRFASGASGSAASRLRGLFGGGGAAGSGTAIGTVSSIDGKKLYVTETSGNTIAVATTPESKITKSESVGSGSIHPGDTIVAQGITTSKGTITASSITDSGSSSSAAGGGLSSLFGGGASSSSGSSSSGVSSLFGG